MFSLANEIIFFKFIFNTATNVTYYIKAEVNNVRDRYEDTTDVVLTIHGSNGQTEPLTLKLNKANKVDNFEFEALDVGTVSF